MHTFTEWIKVQSYKHDGTLHRCWDRNLFVDENEDFFITISQSTMVTESDGRRWHSKEPAVSFFSKNDWYNVIAMIKPEGVIFYINIASPTLLDNHILKYVDYDLDFKLYPDGFIALLDQKEFIRHQTKYKYSASLIATIELMTSQIGMWLKEKRYPFNVDTVTNYYKEFKALKKD